MNRQEGVAGVRRVVVKLGTSLLTNADRALDAGRVCALADQIAALWARGLEVAVVSSGAIGAGMTELGLARRPTVLAELQACAAVGQTKLMSLYEAAFRRHGLCVAQVLLTHDDLSDRDRHLNARNTLDTLLARRVVPVINENDTVSVAEIRFGDNDLLSALVATLLPADVLVILTSAEGLMSRPDGTGERISVVEKVDAGIERMAGGAGSAQSVGGMISKLQSAKIVTAAGIPLIIANGHRSGTLEQALAGADVGTLFLASARKLASRKRWIAFYHRPTGYLVVDDGARKALTTGGRSLLARGVVEAGGSFSSGDVVAIRDRDGIEFARGVARLAAADVAGARQNRITPEVVHRNDLVLL